jgi:hypothetical protein
VDKSVGDIKPLLSRFPKGGVLNEVCEYFDVDDEDRPA